MPPVHDEESELRKVRNREIELKRIRGEIACAECRRLKLKCDKRNPCSTCIRRGCRDVCPTRTNILSPEKIFEEKVAALTQPQRKSPRDVQGMKQRIKALEDALAKQCGPSSHPLLAPHLLIEGTDFNDHQSDDVDFEDTVLDAIGMLSISEGKTIRYFGATASVFLVEQLDPDAPKLAPEFNLGLPKEIVQASRMWPFLPAYLSDTEYIVQLASYLPSYERVVALSNVCFSNLMQFIIPVDRSQLTEEIIPLFYPLQRPISPVLVKEEHLHDLAMLFMILACGCLGLCRRPVKSQEGERYHQLARSALGLRSFIDYGTLEACQTLFMMGQYDNYSGRKTSTESMWKSASVALATALTIGLQRDPSRWKLNAKTTKWWRRAFWEMNLADKRTSLESGRPVIFESSAVDCEFPPDNYAFVKEDGTVVESSCQWRYRFARDVLSVLAKKLSGPRLPKYSEIVEMDKLIRDFDLHPLFDDGADLSTYGITAGDGEYPILHPMVSWWWKHATLFYVHRNYFARALLEYPKDPMRSPFGPSFQSAYHAATTIITTIYGAQVRLPVGFMLERQWPVWAVILSCSVIVGTVACRLLTINFASSALETLEKAIRIFETAASEHVPPNGLDILYRLRDKANAALNAHSSQLTVSPSGGDVTRKGPSISPDSLIPQLPNEFSEIAGELDMLRGTPRYVERKKIFPDRMSLEPPFAAPQEASSEGSSPGSSGGSTVPATASSRSSEERESAFSYMLRMHSIGASLTPSPLVGTDPGGVRVAPSPSFCREGEKNRSDQSHREESSRVQRELPTSVHQPSVLKNRHPRSESSAGAFNEAQKPLAVPLPSDGGPSPWYSPKLDESGASHSSPFGPFPVDGGPRMATTTLFDGNPLDPFSFDTPGQFMPEMVTDFDSPMQAADLDAVYQTSTYGNAVEAWNELLRQFETDSNPI